MTKNQRNFSLYLCFTWQQSPGHNPIHKCRLGKVNIHLPISQGNQYLDILPSICMSQGCTKRQQFNFSAACSKKKKSKSWLILPKCILDLSHAFKWPGNLYWAVALVMKIGPQARTISNSWLYLLLWAIFWSPHPVLQLFLWLQDWKHRW